MGYKFLGLGYNPATLEELSQYYHRDTPITLHEVPVNVFAGNNYITGLFIRGNRKVIFKIQINDPTRLNEMTGIMRLCESNGTELDFLGNYSSNSVELSKRKIGETKETRERLDAFAVDGLRLGRLGHLLTR